MAISQKCRHGERAAAGRPDRREMRTLPRVTAESGGVPADPDDAMFAIPPLLWCVGVPAVLLPAGTLAPLLALWMVARLLARSPLVAPDDKKKASSGAGSLSRS